MMPPIFAFWIAIALIVAGFVVLAPLVRVIARAVEKRLESGDGVGGSDASELVSILRRIEERMDAIESEQERLREHQDFMDALMEGHEPPRIADTSTADEEEEESGDVYRSGET